MAKAAKAATAGSRRSSRRRCSVISAGAFSFLGLFFTLLVTLVIYAKVHELRGGEDPIRVLNAEAPVAASAAINKSARKRTSADAAAKEEAPPPPSIPSLRAAKKPAAKSTDNVRPDQGVSSGLGDPLARMTNFTTSRYAGGGQGGRFPARGSDEFARECGWTMSPPPERRDCVLLVRPTPGGNEGISLWVSMIVNGYTIARQAGCRLLLDYGEGIDVREVMDPVMVGDKAVGTGPNEGLYDWSVPAGFECEEKDRCFLNRIKRNEATETWLPHNVSIVDAPSYRFALQYNKMPKEGEKCQHCIYDDGAAALQHNLPGFRIETGFACVFGNLFRPAPTAAQFEPRLFTDILPALHDPSALALAIYMRTGQTDQTAGYEERKRKGENVTEPLKNTDFSHSAEKMIKMCVAPLEKQYLTGTADIPSGRESLSKVVWIILTDSPNIKEWAVNKYTSGGRTVLVTSARGVHTRTRRNPSTADFAEGLLDWWLMGESDAVVQNGLTFGTTASFRTARPIYHSTEKCSRKVMVFDKSIK